ncbi:hypothetical protein J4462_01385 [Candidatus Pacearchaeota archaeon]|nr:hypothetical protein [Candidatus Pacearchaeota archaeon]
MAKREKRLRKSIESIKKQIEEHFKKLEEDIAEGNDVVAGYHIKEIDKSLIDDLEYRMELLGKVDKNVLERYRRRLGEIGEKIGFVE